MKATVEYPGPLGEGPGGSLIGVVLCGGESRRMGSDKGLLLKDGIPRAAYMGRKLGSLNPVFYSIHPRQQEAYAAVFPKEVLIPDSIAIPGPLGGLLSVHQRMPGPDILLVACDMLDLDEPTIMRLVAAWQVHEADVDFLAYGDDRLWQPFCCIYTSRGLRKAAGESLQSVLRAGRTQALPIGDPQAFNNYNT